MMRAGHGVRAAVAGEVGSVGAQGVEHGALDGGDVGDRSTREALKDYLSWREAALNSRPATG